jgi:sterol 3beta-glucosyltransferase
VCGYWFLPDVAEWQPEEECRTFLAQAPTPIYFSLAGINYAPRESLIDLALEALQRTGQRGLLFLGHHDDGEREYPPFALPVRNIPHNWLFPRVAAVVHHGGAGTTASILRAGVPSVGVPGYWDQPFWSRRIHALGAGPSPIPLKRLSVDRLTAAIEKMLATQAMRGPAEALGEKIRQENGVGQAVELLEKHCAMPRQLPAR